MPRSIDSNSRRWWLGVAALIVLLCVVVLVVVLWEKWSKPPPPEPLRADLSEACSETAWIGMLKPKPRREAGEPAAIPTLECPEGWVWLFSSDPAQPPPPGLQRFCRYVGKDEDPRLAYRAIENPLVGYGEFENIERDCRVVGPAAETIWPLPGLYDALIERFRENAGVAPANPQQMDEVRLVIVDSAQDTVLDANGDPLHKECPATSEEGELECSRHAEVLVKLAQELLCAGANCPTIRTRRALAWTHEIRSASLPPLEVELAIADESAAEGQGGSSGTTENLATAIRRPVAEWWEEPPQQRPKLILNLSVGWERIHLSHFEVMPEMVRAAIQDAVCRGVPVIAAAGNRVAGPPFMETPILPGAWEQVEAPAASRCMELLDPSDWPQIVAPDEGYRPLVYAVGGVQHDSKPLSNSRPNATPRLVAFGDHASAYDPDSPAGIKTLTGTSVSTLVVSAAAAKLWGQHPDYTYVEVMNGLWGQAEEYQVDQAIDFCLKPEEHCSSGQKARRIYVQPPPDAQTSPGAPTPQYWPPKFDEEKVEELIQSIGSLSVLTVQEHCNPQALKVAELPSAGEEPCPQRRFDLQSKPWTGPQPQAIPCSGCGFGGGSPGTLVLQFDPCFRVEGKPAWIDDFTLIVAGEAFRLPIDGFLLGDPSQPCPQPDDPRRVQVVLTDLNFDEVPHPMYLAVTVNGQDAALSPILQVLSQGQQ